MSGGSCGFRYRGTYERGGGGEHLCAGQWKQSSRGRGRWGWNIISYRITTGHNGNIIDKDLDYKTKLGIFLLSFFDNHE